MFYATEAVKKTKKARPSKNAQIQERLEDYITRYQLAYQSQDYSVANDVYDDIVALYQPLSFTNVWYDKVSHLYDSKDDFDSEYLDVFLKCLREWKPRHERQESKFNGKGEFKNYFWSALRYFFINAVKGEAICRKNTMRQCPICGKWCSPISTHLLKVHHELLWDHLATCGIDYKTLGVTGCPYCKTFKRPRRIECSPEENYEQKLADFQNKAVQKHMLSVHSNILFERFHMLYPECVTLSSKPVSVNVSDDVEGEMSIYEMMPHDGKFNNLLSLSFSTVQEKLLRKIFQGALDVKYDHKLYKCSQEEFENELNDLRSKMVISGFEG